ncbi:hypothetical protein [Aeribacillus pallidus]|uniref:hypothetical protein n=1 Tax=Aeribacillus pallidus TaxID=33936 RepID=UPI003D19A297
MTISEEKRKWMQEVGIQEFKRPMKYHIYGWLLSEEYIAETSLEELKARLENVKNSGSKPIIE